MTKHEIVEVFERNYKRDGFPPLAGKIVGIFYVNNEKNLDFQKVVKLSGASKAAVSKTLKVLITMNRIGVSKHPTDNRKKLYFLDIENLIKYLRLVISNYQELSDLLHAVLEVRSDKNAEMNDFIKQSIAFNDEMLAFLNKKAEQYFT